MTGKFSATGVVDQATRIAIQSLSKQIEELRGQLEAGVGRKNLFDNGAMNVSQRGTSLAGLTSGNFLADRWQMGLVTLGTWTYTQATDGPASTQFVSSLKLQDTTADASPAAGDNALVQQAIEGQYLQHLLWGTTKAKPLTLSFWVKATITGTFIAELARAEGTARSVSRRYTINSANTWEFKTITFPGDLTTAITNDTANRLRLLLWIAAGSTYTGGAALQESWDTQTNNLRAVGLTNLAATVNNTIQFTGVQLEIGSEATDFETVVYADDLWQCMRYFQKYTNPPLRGTMAAAANSIASRMAMLLPVPMRGTPVASISAALPIYDGVSTGTANSIANDFCTSTVCELQFNSTIAAGLAGRPLSVYQSGGASTMELTADI